MEHIPAESEPLVVDKAKEYLEDIRTRPRGKGAGALMDRVASLGEVTKEVIKEVIKEEVTKENEEEHPAAADGLIDDTSDLARTTSVPMNIVPHHRGHQRRARGPIERPRHKARDYNPMPASHMDHIQAGGGGGGGGVPPWIGKSYTGTPWRDQHHAPQHRASHFTSRPVMPCRPGRYRASPNGPPRTPANKLRLPHHPTRPTAPWAAAIYGQPAPPPPFHFRPGTSSTRAPDAASHGPPRAPPTSPLSHKPTRPTPPWAAAAAHGQPAPPPAADPFELSVRRPALPRHYD
ncbi:hypothetical protein DL764_003977 [Monosporascus ibericus]|uniref:Uncharacterized protein n=1 Tax=Monosporascus ibericus TaxID=155417 RepID=A0A4Q4TI23_9PEZI|nr:hypothetical protein DL764_003977 [Monosporascus ibericus]